MREVAEYFNPCTNERLDRLERRVDVGFDQVHSRIDALHQMMHRTMLQLGAGMIVTLALALLGVILTR